jgi:hypothetical protein
MLKRIIAVIGLIFLLSEASNGLNKEKSIYVSALFKPAIEKIIKFVN